jgi:hypothetical protein
MAAAGSASRPPVDLDDDIDLTDERRSNGHPSTYGTHPAERR